jgi:hypothetical protein
MNFDDLERPTWGVVSPREGDMGLVRETVRKEQAIKWVYISDIHSAIHRMIYLQGNTCKSGGSKGFVQSQDVFSN